MPNIQFDIFYDNDVFNFTATRSQGIPKVKPAWKVRTAPKLPPKEKSEAELSAKPTRPTPKPISKPTVQSKSAPVVPKKQAPTLKGSSPTNAAKPQANTAKTLSKPATNAA